MEVRVRQRPRERIPGAGRPGVGEGAQRLEPGPMPEVSERGKKPGGRRLGPDLPEGERRTLPDEPVRVAQRATKRRNAFGIRQRRKTVGRRRANHDSRVLQEPGQLAGDALVPGAGKQAGGRGAQDRRGVVAGGRHR